MIKLNLGCGKDKKDGYVNLDISDKVSADIVCDIEDGLPFEVNYFDEVLAYNVLEQISNPKKFIFVMNELHRIIKENGSLTVRVPNADDICAFQDPMDIMRFTEESFTYLQYNHPRFEEFGRHYGFKPWLIKRVKNAANVSSALLVFYLQPSK